MFDQVEHALLEELLIDPAADVTWFRANFERLLAINDQRTRLPESLLTLAGRAHVRDRGEPFDWRRCGANAGGSRP
ncbi:hypothetical protein [Streptomyces sp. NPDC051636]|uniref:hypothetical protein n=1 Tax=Streptomyces sp. NPDC051636 TaxID=3365663 RepID=UPI003789B39A